MKPVEKDLRTTLLPLYEYYGYEILLEVLAEIINEKDAVTIESLRQHLSKECSYLADDQR